MKRFTARMFGMIAATAVVSFMLAAQPMRMTPQERTDKLTKDLSLTKKQQAKVLDIFTKSQGEMKKIRDEHEGDFEAMRPAMMKVREETDAELKKVLSAEQYEKFLKQRAESRGGMQRP
ncbi:MAG TPA: hypothetical protein VK470_16030 [Bacteroidota bacterium]|nr:hypothetical protein [Bacteroidota bacterium]